MSVREHPDFIAESEYLKFILAYLEAYQERACRQKRVFDKKVEESLKAYNSNNPDQFNGLTFNIENQGYLNIYK